MQQVGQLHSQSPAQAASSAPAAAASPVLQPLQSSIEPVQSLTCLVCVHSNPVPVGYDFLKRWRCSACHLRGDLDGGHATNTFLASMVARSSTSTTSGQSHDTPAAVATPTIKEALRGLDAHFTALALKGPTMSLFEGTAAQTSLSPAEAHGISRKAVGASATENTGLPLMALIRSGKLPSVGYALPRRLDAASVAEEADVNASALYALGINPRDIKSLIAPDVPNSRAFCLTIFAVIIPSIIDKPAAIMEWATLARTALELESLHKSWPVAYSYVQQLLNDRIAKGEGFSSTSIDCLSTLWAAKHAQAAGGTSTQATKSDTRGSAPQRTCNNWNNNKVCQMSPCRFKHACGGCGSPSHKTYDPVCKRSPSTTAASGGKPRSSGSTVASVASKPQKSAAAATQE